MSLLIQICVICASSSHIVSDFCITTDCWTATRIDFHVSTHFIGLFKRQHSSTSNNALKFILLYLFCYSDLRFYSKKHLPTMMSKKIQLYYSKKKNIIIVWLFTDHKYIQMEGSLWYMVKRNIKRDLMNINWSLRLRRWPKWGKF